MLGTIVALVLRRGEQSASIAVQRQAKGIPVAGKVWAELETAGEKRGIAVPWSDR